jgi:RimJ/RimL family protein N-acetyltransferase
MRDAVRGAAEGEPSNEIAGAAVCLRPAGANDCRSLWEWRSEDAARVASFDSRPIPFEDHVRWFERRLPDIAETIFVASAEGRDIGYVRFDVDGDEARVSIALAPEARGRGYGTAAIADAVRAFSARRPSCRVTALIRPDNVRSLAAFRRAGFVPAPSQPAGSPTSVMVWPHGA